MAGDESRGGTTITTYHDWLRAWQCVQAIRPTATIVRVFGLVPGHQGGWVRGWVGACVGGWVGGCVRACVRQVFGMAPAAVERAMPDCQTVSRALLCHPVCFSLSFFFLAPSSPPDTIA